MQLLIHTGISQMFLLDKLYTVILLMLLKWTSFKQTQFCSELLTRRTRSGIYIIKSPLINVAFASIIHDFRCDTLP